MGLSSVELWQRIAASQLASPLLCRTWAADAATALSATESMDGQRVGEQLVKQGKLTQFQVDTLLSDNPLPLIRNGYRLLEPVADAPHAAPNVRAVWKDWWAVAKTPTAPTLWMRWIQAEDFKQPALAQCNPALPRALQQSHVRHDCLQTVQPPEMAKGTLQLCVEPLQGRLLSGLCTGQPMPLESVLKLWSDVAAALAPLHAAGLAHGRITPDRICVSEAGQHSVLRDPLCGATMHMGSGKSSPATGLIAAQLPGQLEAVHFLAPEFLLPAQLATPQSDLYSLGCVVWLLLTGKAPYTARQSELVLAAHAEQPLDPTPVARLPEPLTRCLWHCLAKNPSARFPHAGQLSEALQEAQRIVARGPSTAPKPIPATAKPTAAEVPAKVVTAAEKIIEPTIVAAQPSTIKSAEPTEHKPAPTKPIEAKPAVKPEAAKAAPSKPVESKPVESKPVESKPVESKPVESKPVESKPVESKPVESKPVESKPVVVRPVEQQPVAQQPAPAVVRAAQPADAGTAAPNAQPVVAATSAVAAQATTTAQPQKRLAQPGKPPGRRSPVRKTKKSKAVNWLTPVIGGGALLVLVLIVLVMNGGLGTPSGNSQSNAKANNGPGPANQPVEQPGKEPVAVDPLAEKYELVSDAPTALWAPPRVAEPIQFDLLPPGGQFFACLRPARLMAQADAKQILSLLDSDLSPLWKTITETSGVPLEQIDQVVMAAYPAESGGPQLVWRFKLTQPQPLSQLKAKWSAPVDTKVKEHSLLVSGPRAIYIPQQPLVESQSVSDFSVGPTEAMREVAEAQGAAAGMSGQMEQLRLTTDKAADINLLVNPVFFYAEGRAWLDQSPPRFRAELEKLVTREMRALMLTTSLTDPWYYEMRVSGSTDRDSTSSMQKLSDAKRQLPQAVESWLVSELPHPHWRAMANRFPNMLRAFDAQTRFGVENGQAVMNGYLPIAAAPNLIYASWMAFQPGSTAAGASAVASATSDAPAASALTPEQILDRKITVAIDQTGIENVLQAIGEQANDKLPAGTKPLRFELDGAGFQRSGITRNQQIKDFQVKDQTVREALIVLAKKGNPVQPLNDLKSDDQKLIWVLIDGGNPDKALLSLTSREAALSAGHKLPAEFVK